MHQPARRTPAGWYRDPGELDQLRWWTGTHWSAVCATVAALTSPDPRSIVPQPGATLAVSIAPRHAGATGPTRPPLPIPGHGPGPSGGVAARPTVSAVSAVSTVSTVSTTATGPTSLAVVRPPVARRRGPLPAEGDGRYRMLARAAAEIVREPGATDELAGRYHIVAAPVRECFVPRWETPAPFAVLGPTPTGLVAPLGPLGPTPGVSDPVPVSTGPFALVAAFVLVPAGLLAAASCGQGPLAGVWHWAFG